MYCIELYYYIDIRFKIELILNKYILIFDKSVIIHMYTF